MYYKDHSPVDCEACNSRVAEFFRCFKKTNYFCHLKANFYLVKRLEFVMKM